MAKDKRRAASRIMVMSGDIDSSTVKNLIWDIFEINEEDTGLAKADREPIMLVLNSTGGNVYDGFALIGAMEQSITPVHVNILGQAQSMGLAIAVSGHVRTANRHTIFMYHGISYEMGQEKNIIHEQELNEAKRMQKQYNSLIVEKTRIKAETLKNLTNLGKETYWTASQALKMGIIDKIV